MRDKADLFGKEGFEILNYGIINWDYIRYNLGFFEKGKYRNEINLFAKEGFDILNYKIINLVWVIAIFLLMDLLEKWRFI